MHCLTGLAMRFEQSGESALPRAAPCASDVHAGARMHDLPDHLHYGCGPDDPHLNLSAHPLLFMSAHTPKERRAKCTAPPLPGRGRPAAVHPRLLRQAGSGLQSGERRCTRCSHALLSHSAAVRPGRAVRISQQLIRRPLGLDGPQRAPVVPSGGMGRPRGATGLAALGPSKAPPCARIVRSPPDQADLPTSSPSGAPGKVGGGGVGSAASGPSQRPWLHFPAGLRPHGARPIHAAVPQPGTYAGCPAGEAAVAIAGPPAPPLPCPWPHLCSGGGLCTLQSWLQHHSRLPALWRWQAGGGRRRSCAALHASRGLSVQPGCTCAPTSLSLQVSEGDLHQSRWDLDGGGMPVGRGRGRRWCLPAFPPPPLWSLQLSLITPLSNSCLLSPIQLVPTGLRHPETRECDRTGTRGQPLLPSAQPHDCRCCR